MPYTKSSVLRTIRSTTRNALSVVALLLALVACSGEPDDPEAQIRAMFDAAETAAEERDLGALRPFIAHDYTDREGRDRQAVENLVRLYFLANQRIHLLVKVQTIQILSPGVAKAELVVATAGAPVDDVSALASLRAQVQRLNLTLQDYGDGDWRVRSVDWSRGDVTDML